MRIYDVSLAITPGLPRWPGSPPIELERTSRIEAGANSNSSRLALGVHTGTHVDAPLHFLPGKPGVDQLPLDVLAGPAHVAYLPRAEQVTAAALESAGVPPRVRRLLLRTRNSNFWRDRLPDFQEEFAGLTPDGAVWVVSRRIQLIGVDYLSVAPYKQSRPTHEVLLKAGVVVVEGLNLDRIRPGRYEFVCLPLKLVDADGAPARAILIERGRR